MTAALLERPTTAPPADWKLRGLCNGRVTAEADWWFSDDPAEQEQAKAVCRRCPVLGACLADVRAHPDPFGVRGALTAAERAGAPGYLRPSVYGTPAHGENRWYERCTAGPDGKACTSCRRAHASHVAGWRLRRSWTVTGPVTRRGSLVVVVAELHTPHGRGRRTAYPGQLIIPIEGAVA